MILTSGEDSPKKEEDQTDADEFVIFLSFSRHHTVALTDALL